MIYPLLPQCPNNCAGAGGWYGCAQAECALVAQQNWSCVPGTKPVWINHL